MKPPCRLFNYLKQKCINLKLLRCNHSYNVLFFGSEIIAMSSLKRINQLRKSSNIINRFDIVTTNSKNKSSIETFAHSENLGLVSWPLHDMKTNEYDIGLIVAFGHLIKDDLLKKFPMGMVNVHPSLLPRWRGAAPIIHTLLHGDQVTGVTLMKIKADIFDVGEIISQKQVSVPKDIMLPELTSQLSEIGAEMLAQCVSTLPESLKNLKPQSSEGVTYAKKINKNISNVKWAEMSSFEVYNLYRAIYGLFSLTTKFKDTQMKLFDAFLKSDLVESDNKIIGKLEYCEKTDSIRILCKDMRYIYFKSLRLVGKRKISAVDFYNGYIKNLPVEKRNVMVTN